MSKFQIFKKWSALNLILGFSALLLIACSASKTTTDVVPPKTDDKSKNKTIIQIPTCADKEPLNTAIDFDKRKGYVFGHIYQKHDITLGEYKQPLLCDGKQWTFYFKVVGGDDPLMADEEYTKELMFSIPVPKGKSFQLSEADLMTANAHYYISCFCPEIGYFALSKGSIEGKKIGKNKWEVMVSSEYGKDNKFDIKQKYYFEVI